MRSHIATVIVILGVSSGAAVATNFLRDRPLDWIRRELPSSDKKPGEPSDPAPPKDRGAARGEPPAPGSGLTAEAVIGHLTNRTARFIDAREAKDYAEGHLRGAINLPSSAIYENIDRVIHQVPPNEKIIVYCGGGDCEASHSVADALQRDFKYQDVTIYVKGWEEVEKVDRFKPFVATGTEP